MRRFLPFVILLMAIVQLNSFTLAQDTAPNTPPNTGSNPDLSPDGLHLGVLTIDSFGETTLEVRSTKDTTEHIRLIPDLTMFDSFVWSPNSRYIAAIGHRGNASGSEYAVQVFDIFEEPHQDAIMAWTNREFGEFVAYEDPEQRSDFAPVWSTDGSIIALNRRDGIYFYDITDCEGEQCSLLYSLNIGYAPFFAWQGTTIVTLRENILQVWDIEDLFQK